LCYSPKIKRRLGDTKAQWSEEFHLVMWVCHATPHLTMVESSFCFTEGTEVARLEIGEIK